MGEERMEEREERQVNISFEKTSGILKGRLRRRIDDGALGKW
jgi:hypothetical protein